MMRGSGVFLPGLAGNQPFKPERLSGAGKRISVQEFQHVPMGLLMPYFFDALR